MAGIMPNEGKEYSFTDRFRAGQDYTLHIYTNSVSLVDTVELSDFTELTASGYSAATLSGGSWTISTDGSNVTSASYAQQTFTFTAEDTEGYYIVDPTGTYVVYAESFGGTQSTGEIKITPIIKKE